MLKFLKQRKKDSVFIILFIVLSFALLTTSLAYLKNKNEKTNNFIVGNVKAEIKEDFDAENNVKKNVFIKNTGNVSSYVRVAILFNFKDKQGNILGEAPVLNEDYMINFSSSDNWKLMDDGYYYYKNIVMNNKSTDILINECKPLKKYDDRVFEVDIIVQQIQANPSKAVKEAWGVNLKDDMISFE